MRDSTNFRGYNFSTTNYDEDGDVFEPIDFFMILSGIKLRGNTIGYRFEGWKSKDDFNNEARQPKRFRSVSGVMRNGDLTGTNFVRDLRRGARALLNAKAGISITVADWTLTRMQVNLERKFVNCELTHKTVNAQIVVASDDDETGVDFDSVMQLPDFAAVFPALDDFAFTFAGNQPNSKVLKRFSLIP